MDNINPFYIPNSSRGIVAGQTGTGKTTVARLIIADKPHLITIDPKHEFTPLQEHIIVDKYSELEKFANQNREGRAIVYRPNIVQLENMEEINKVLMFAFLRTNTFIHVTELAAIVKNAMSYPYFLRAVYTQGRSKNVGILGETQRPVNIPAFCLSECEYFWKFFLLKRTDQERMSEYMGKEVVEPKDYPNSTVHPITGKEDVSHSFFYFRNGMRKSILYRVKM